MKIIALFLTVFLFFTINAQLTRYPYIQSTTQNSVIVAWKTQNSVLGMIKYGTDSSNLVFTEIESSTSTIHALLLDNLIENTKYYYEIYSGITLETSEYFYSAKDSTNNQFSFIQYGDCGYNSTVQHQIGDLMEADEAEFAVVCGDIDQGGVPHFSTSGGGDDYDEIYFDVYNDGINSKMLSRECHYTAIGNHDYYANNGAEYDNVFYLPHNNAENSERYYSFTWGDAKFICLDVITPYDDSGTIPPFLNMASINDRWWTDFRQGSPQYQFLEQELQCNDKKWVFVYFHEGPWTNYWGADYYVIPAVGGDYYLFDGNIMVRDHLVPIFEEYDVDFVLTGHSHLYERGEKNGVTYITSGSAGDSNLGANIQYANHPEIVTAILDNVYTKFKVDNDSVFLEVINKDSIIVDTFSKTKIFTAFNVNSSVTNVSCHGQNDGSATVNVLGPKPPYTIEWLSDNDTLFTKNNLSAGTHFAYVSNAYNCEKIISVTIDEPPVLIPQIVSSNGNDMFCEGESIKLSTFDTLSYSSYTWSNGDTNAQISLTNEETISVTVISNDGCHGTSAPFSVSYIEPANIVDVNYANSGTSYNFLVSGNNIETYFWDFGDGTDTALNTNLVNHIFEDSTYYTIHLFASNECNTDSFSFDLLVGDTALGTFEMMNSENITVSPNPFSYRTKITTENIKGLLQISLYNNLGERMLYFKTRKKSFYLSKNNLSKGIYYLTILDKNNNKYIYKLLVK